MFGIADTQQIISEIYVYLCNNLPVIIVAIQNPQQRKQRKWSFQRNTQSLYQVYINDRLDVIAQIAAAKYSTPVACILQNKQTN